MDDIAKPITLYDWEVRAVHDGRKTQLRRLMEPQPEYKTPGVNWVWQTPKKNLSVIWERHKPAASGVLRWCPFPVGTLLWVRETWWTGTSCDCATCGKQCAIKYKASWDGKVAHWLSPVTMPRWASRLTLRVTDVQVERTTEWSWVYEVERVG